MESVIKEHYKNKFISKKELELINALIESGQKHLFDSWDKPGVNDDKKKALINSLIKVDRSYHGGIIRYIEKAKKLLLDSKNRVNSYKNFTPEKPQVIDLSKINALYAEMEETGLKNAGTTAFVMVAGGLGERLGYNDIKINIPLESSAKTTYIKHYTDYIKTIQRRAGHSGKRKAEIPFIIMTSDDTHNKTLKTLEDNSYFGLKKKQVIILKQDPVPALSGNNAGIALKEPYIISLKPHGHGDIHTLMFKNKLLKKLLKKGIKHIIFIQDTNGNVFNAMLPALGAAVHNSFKFNFLAIPRFPGDAIGTITRLRSGEKELTVNIEYNELDSLLKDTINPEGDVPGKDGYSLFPGNPNILIIDAEFYYNLLKRTGGEIPEFINPKYTDDSREKFAKPARIETLMQDITKLFEKDDKAGITVFDRKWCFSPVKNSIEGAKEKNLKNIPCESAATGESDFYLAERVKLGFGNVRCEKGAVKEFSGVPFLMEARAVLSPDFILTHADAVKKIKGGHLSKDSTLILDGESIFIENLIMKEKSGLVVKLCPGSSLTIKDLTVENEGFEIIELTESEMNDAGTPEYLKIRGYKIIQKAPLIISITKKGNYTLGPGGLTLMS